MTNPLNSFQTNFGRFYRHPSSGNSVESLETLMGKMSYREGPFSPRPSITNIIGMIDKKFLPGYYARLVAEYAVRNLPTIQYQAEKFGEDYAIGSLKAVPSAPNRNANIGDEIHDAIDQWVKDREHVPEFSTSTAANMYHQWLCFASQGAFEVVRSEFTVWSYAHGYAGTGDLMLDWPGLGLGIVDTKSGNQVYPEVALQTTALTHADVILDANGNESPMPRIDWQGVMHIRPRSIKLYELDRTDEAWETFLAAKRIFDWKRFDAPLVMATPPTISQKPKDA